MNRLKTVFGWYLAGVWGTVWGHVAVRYKDAGSLPIDESITMLEDTIRDAFPRGVLWPVSMPRKAYRSLFEKD